MEYEDIVCPQCGSEDVRETDFEWRGAGRAEAYFECDDCGCRFHAICHLVFESDLEIDEFGKNIDL